MRKTIFAAVLSIVVGFPILSKADTGTVQRLSVGVADQWGACVYVMFKETGQWFSLLRSDPGFEQAKNWLLWAATTGPVTYYLSGSACGAPKINYIELGH
jgi:hypothetical protein